MSAGASLFIGAGFACASRSPRICGICAIGGCLFILQMLLRRALQFQGIRSTSRAFSTATVHRSALPEAFAAIVLKRLVKILFFRTAPVAFLICLPCLKRLRAPVASS